MQKKQNQQEKVAKMLRHEMLNVVTYFTIVAAKFKASSRMNVDNLSLVATKIENNP